MSLEVIIRRQNSGADQLFLKNIHKIQQVLRLSAANVIDLVRRDGEAVFAGLLLRSFGHHAHDAFHDVIHIGKVASAVAIVVDLDGLTLEQLVGEAEVRHVRSTSRAIDSKEPQSGTGDVVEFAIAVSHQFVAFLGCCIKTHGVIHTIVSTEGHLLVAAVHAGRRGIYQVLDALILRFFSSLRMTKGLLRMTSGARNDVIGVSTGLKDVVEADDVALDIDIGVLDAVANTCLRGKVDYDVEVVFCEESIDQFPVSDIALDELVIDGRRLRLVQFSEAILLEGRIIVVVEIVNAHDGPFLHILEKALDQIGSNESG